MNRITVNQGDSLSAKLTTAKSLYVISGICDLAGAEVKVPEGSTLVFDYGTKIKNGKLVLNNTIFEGAKHCVTTEVCGEQDELDTDYFDLTLSNKTAIMQSIINTARRIQLHGRYENVFVNIEIGRKEVTLVGNGATIVNNLLSATSAISITTDSFVRIADICFEINSGYAIQKEAPRSTETYLSFMIDRCRFVATSNSVSALIKLISSREGNITNCFFEGVNASIGIDRQNAVNTNVIGCMFKKLNYGIKAVAVHTNADTDDLYTSYACGLNVQSAVMLGCTYGIFIEGNDSFFLNNSMIDYCTNPLVIISQDGANITNNYFSTSTSFSIYNAVITLRNNTDKTSANENKRIIISGNTLYGHRENLCYGIDMDVECIDCTIQGNTFDYFTNHGIYLRHPNTGAGWLTEKLVIDNNRFHFANDEGADGISGYNYSGECKVIVSNNYAEEKSNTKLLRAGSTNYGNYLFFGNHDYLANVPSGNEGSKIYDASRRNHTRMKIDLLLPASVNQLEIDNPMVGDTNIVVQVANNRYPVCVYSISTTKIKFNRATTNTDAIAFTAIIEHLFNL